MCRVTVPVKVVHITDECRRNGVNSATVFSGAAIQMWKAYLAILEGGVHAICKGSVITLSLTVEYERINAAPSANRDNE